MTQVAICLRPTCRATFALLLPLDRAFCPVCQHQAVVGQGGAAGFLRLFHEAIPTAITRKQKREILALGRKVIDAQLDAAQTLEEAQNMSPATRELFFKWSGWAFGALGAGAAIASLILQLGDQNSSHDEREELVDTATALLKKTNQTQSEAPRKSRRSQARNQASDQAQSAGAPRRTERTKPRRRRGPGDVPFG